MSGTSTVVKTAALAMMGTTLALFSANAQQQVAVASGPDYSACDRISASNPLGATRCRVETLQAHTLQLRAEGAAAQSRTLASNNEGTCADTIKSEITAGRIKPEALRAVLAGRPAREVGACNLLKALTQG